MSYPINKNINPYQQQQLAMGVTNNPQLNLQNIDTNAVTQNIVENSALKGVNDSENGMFSPKTFLISLPVWAAMVFGMDKFNAACGEKNLMKTVGDFGERIGLKIEEKIPYIKKFFKGMENGKSSFLNDAVPKSNILSAIFKTPAQPEKHMILTMYKGTQAEIATDAAQKLEQYLKDNKELMSKVGLSAERLKEISASPYEEKNIQELISVCEKLGPDATVTKASKIPFIGKIVDGNEKLSNLLNRPIHFSEYANKLKAFNNGNTTYLGKKLPRALIRTLEGLTNGTAGGKLAILMGSYFIGDAIVKTIQAPKGHGEKRKTFAENIFYNVGWYLTAPLALAFMYKPAGLKYIGFNEEQVKEYRARIKQFNDMAKSGQIKELTDYKTKKQELKNDLKKIFDKTKSSIEVQKADSGIVRAKKFFANLIRKPLKLAAKIFTFGMEQPEAFNPKGIGKESSLGEKIEQFVKHGKAKNVKGFAGAVMRFSVFMFAVSPVLGKLCAKASHIIFGKPTKSVLDEGKEPEKKNPPLIIPQQVPQQPQQQLPQQAQQTQQTAPSVVQPVQNTNLAYNPQQQTENIVNSYADERTMIPSEEPTRKYIPSEEGVRIHDDVEKKKQQDDKVAAWEKKAAAAEKSAQKFIVD